MLATTIYTTTTNPVLANSNEKFIEDLKHKSNQAFQLFYELYAPSFYGQIKRALYKDEVCSIALANAFVAIYNTIEKYNPSKETLFVWSFGIVRREISKQKTVGLLKDIFAC